MISINYLIIKELYALSSIIYIKGIADANGICVPYIAEETAERDDKYTTFVTLDNEKAIEWKMQDYLTAEIMPLISKSSLFNLRNFIIFQSNEAQVIAMCHLLDYIYRIGLKHNRKYVGHQTNEMSSHITGNASTFFTPEGRVSVHYWHDLLRKYIVIIKNTQGEESVMDELNLLMAISLKNQREINQIKRNEEERRLSILSREDILHK